MNILVGVGSILKEQSRGKLLGGVCQQSALGVILITRYSSVKTGTSAKVRQVLNKQKNISLNVPICNKNSNLLL